MKGNWKHADSDAWHCDKCGKVRDYKHLYINPDDKALTICSWCQCEDSEHAVECDETSTVTIRTMYGPFEVCTLCLTQRHMGIGAVKYE